MSNVLPEYVSPEVREFITETVEWARSKDDLLALALVGSQARGEAKPESDIDILLLFQDPELYFEDSEWISLFGDVSSKVSEDWGKVTSLRVQYSNGLEFEFGLTDGSWGSDPKDAGDKQVIDDGMIVLYEKQRHLSRKLSRYTTASGSNSLNS